MKVEGKFWGTFKVIKVSGGWQVQVNYNSPGEDIRDNFDSKYDFTGLTIDNLEVFVYQYLLPLLTKKLIAKLGI